jgi:xylulokinase
LTTPVIDPALRYYVFNHAVADTWYAAAATLAAGLSLRWLRDVLGEGGQADAYAQLSAAAGQIRPGADGLLFLPYLAGERTPHFDPEASGLFLGLRLHHDRGHLARAVMEGVAYSLLTCLDLLPEQPEKLILSGGAAESAVWRGILADVFGQPLWIAAGGQQACIGAALVAGVGTGLYADFAAASVDLPQPVTVTQPDPANVALYAARRSLYDRLYDQLKETMHTTISLL